VEKYEFMLCDCSFESTYNPKNYKYTEEKFEERMKTILEEQQY